MSPEQVNNFADQNFQESTICEGGGILVPSLGSQCSSSFNKICSGFLASYRQMFVSRPVDGSLCWWVDTVEVSLQISIAKKGLVTSWTYKGVWGVEANSPHLKVKSFISVFSDPCWARTSLKYQHQKVGSDRPLSPNHPVLTLACRGVGMDLLFVRGWNSFSYYHSSVWLITSFKNENRGKANKFFNQENQGHFLQRWFPCILDKLGVDFRMCLNIL